MVPIDGTARGTVWVHSTPISLEVFEQYFEVISAAHSHLFRQGNQTSLNTAMRVAAMHLRKAADQLGQRDELDHGLLPEIERLTQVVALEKDRGWITYPYHEARSWLDPEDRSVVENVIAFFIVNSAVVPRAALAGLLGLMASLWGAQTTSSNSTEFAAGLLTSTPDGLPAPAETEASSERSSTTSPAPPSAS